MAAWCLTTEHEKQGGALDSKLGGHFDASLLDLVTLSQGSPVM